MHPHGTVGARAFQPESIVQCSRSRPCIRAGLVLDAGMKSPLLALVLAAASLSLNVTAKEPVAPVLDAPAELKPWQQHRFDLEAGYLWKVGGDTPLNYGMAPVLLTWRSPEVLGLDFANGSRLFVRNRLSLIGQWIETGPENHYFGVMGAPSLEWAAPGGRWSVFAGIGGGAGWIDSQGVEGGQGQDFTLNWFATAGVARALSDSLELRLGALFQHLSNGGATDPNPGVNSLGFTLGVSWGF